MTPTFDDELAAFKDRVEALIAEVARVENVAFRKALYISMLDGLSGCAYPNETKSGKRFKAFVLEIAGWADGERVCLPQAALYFRGNVTMSATITARLAVWPWGQPQPITADPLLNQLPAHADLWKPQHLNLLWQFRNHVLHAFADPGGFNLQDRDQPYYVGDVSTHTWRLVMPEQFLRNLLIDGLRGLIAFCRRKGQDPRAHLGQELWF